MRDRDDESLCEKRSLVSVADLLCPGSNDPSTWKILQCQWMLIKNTGDCMIAVLQEDLDGYYIQVDLLDPDESLDFLPLRKCRRVVVSGERDCSGKGQVKWGAPCEV